MDRGIFLFLRFEEPETVSKGKEERSESYADNSENENNVALKTSLILLSRQTSFKK